jgi:hypothetical protein
MAMHNSRRQFHGGRIITSDIEEMPPPNSRKPSSWPSKCCVWRGGNVSTAEMLKN